MLVGKAVYLLREGQHALLRVCHLQSCQFDRAQQGAFHLGRVVFSAMLFNQRMDGVAYRFVVQVQVELRKSLFVYAGVFAILVVVVVAVAMVFGHD